MSDIEQKTLASDSSVEKNASMSFNAQLTPTPFQFRGFSLSIWALIVANVIPIFGAIFFSWDIGLILVVYWMENVIVGFYNVIKMWMAKPDFPTPTVAKSKASMLLGKFFITCFFTFHFGMFCMVHGVFVILMSQGMDSGFDLSPTSHKYLVGPLMIFALPIGVASSLWELYGFRLLIPVGSVFISHGISFFENYIGKREFETRSRSEQMFQPYARIVVLHVAIVVAGVPVMLLGSPMPLLVLLIIGKTIFDITLHRRSHSPNQSLGVGWFSQLIGRRANQQLKNGKRDEG